MAQTRNMSAPLAIVKVGGVPIGKMKSIQCTETYRLQPTVGIGNLAPDEITITGWQGSLNCGFFLVDLRDGGIPGAFPMVAQTKEEWQDRLTLNSEGVQIDIMRKEKASVGVGGLIVPKFVVFASIKGCFGSRFSFDINDGQIGGHNLDFEYITPILFPV